MIFCVGGYVVPQKSEVPSDKTSESEVWSVFHIFIYPIVTYMVWSLFLSLLFLSRGLVGVPCYISVHTVACVPYSVFHILS